MMKKKYIKGFLCRDANTIFPNTLYWFFEDKPYWDKSIGWFVSCLDTRSRSWDVEKFKEEYDCNFRLPRKGEKVECWIEVGDE